MEELAMQARVSVIYSGHVQGVGFRWTAHGIGKRFEVTGYVQNLADGRVQLEAEGEPAEIDRFLAALAERMRDNIRDAKIERTAATGEFEGFSIRH
jgi:acylphosphatase